MQYFVRWKTAAPWVLAAVMVATSIATPAATSWTQRGGPNGDFKVEAKGLSTRWSESGPPTLWSRELGTGYSGILAEAGRLYTAYREGDQEVLIALDAETGKSIWEYKHPAALHEGQTDRFGAGPNATPLIAGNLIYHVGFTSKLHALNKKTGKPVWSHDLVEEFGGSTLHFGYSASPVLYKKMVIVLVGGEQHAAVGFDSKNGSVRWKSEPFDISYASPLVIDVDGQDQLAFMTPTEVVGVGLSDGLLRWRHPHENQFKNNCSGPWWGEDNLLFVASQGDAGSRTLKLTRSEDKTTVEEVSSNLKMKVFHNSIFRNGDYVYGGSHDFLVAHNVKTGETAWKERGFSEANVIQADGKVVLLDEEGQLGIATMSPEKLTVHASYGVLEKPAWTAPTLVGTRVYVRDTTTIKAIDLGEHQDRDE